MAQADGVVANGTGAAVRSDLNGQLAALFTNHSGSTSPGTTYAHQFWADTNENVLKIRNGANDAWITLRELDGTMLIEDGSASTPGLAFADDTNTGIFSGAADQIGFATGGAERLRLSDGEAVFNDPSNDVDFRVESNGNTHMLFVDAGNNRVGVGNSAPRGFIHIGNDLSSGATDAAAINVKQTGTTAATGIYLERSGERKGYSIFVGGNEDSLTFQRNNAGTKSDALVLTRDGNCGIGTSSPNHKLTLATTSTATFDALNITTGNTNSTGLQLGISSASNAFFWHTANGVIQFATNNVERMRITNDGITFNGDTAATNALSDYEEGTWTATLSYGTCTTSDAKYIKIGKLVRVSATLSGFSDRSSSAGLQITNAPFAGNLSQKAQAAGTQIHRNLDLAAIVSYMSSTGNIEFYAATSGSWSQLAYNDLNSSSSTIYFNAQWMTN